VQPFGRWRMSEKHIIVLGDLRVTVKVTEHYGFIDMKYHFNRRPKMDEIEKFDELNWKALSQWDENPKPNRMTSNITDIEHWSHAHPDDILNGMKRLKQKNKKGVR
jgi:hypothetical protein